MMKGKFLQYPHMDHSIQMGFWNHVQCSHMGHKYALKFEQKIAINAYRSQNITRRNLEINDYNFNYKRKKISRNRHMRLQTLHSP
jgi:hypothetical protein